PKPCSRPQRPLRAAGGSGEYENSATALVGGATALHRSSWPLSRAIRTPRRAPTRWHAVGFCGRRARQTFPIVRAFAHEKIDIPPTHTEADDIGRLIGTRTNAVVQRKQPIDLRQRKGAAQVDVF